MMKDKKISDRLYIIELMLIAVSTLIGAGLGFYGVYLGQKAINLSAESNSLQVRPVLVLEMQPANPSIKIYNVGFGPADIVHFSFEYTSLGGKKFHMDSDKDDFNAQFFEYFNIEGINEDLPHEKLIKSFDPLGLWGVDETIDILSVPGRQSMPLEWADVWMEKVDAIFESFEYCITYFSIDEIENQIFSNERMCEPA